MRKFWANNEELTPEEQRLVNVLFEAHAKCVWRDNCSTQALQQAAFGSKHLPSAIIAALATLGETHGPVEEAYDVLQYNRPHTFDGVIIPGFGNSFIKNRIDDAFLSVDQTLEALFPRHHSRLREITDALHVRGKRVFPNPAAYTATVALVLGMPRHLSPVLFVLGRLEAWAELFNRVLTAKPAEKKEAA
jgi:citrate synthase